MGERMTSQAKNQGAPKGKVFYGWWIVLGGFLMMASCYTIFVNCLPLFQAHIIKDLLLSVSEYNLGVSLTTLVSIFAALVIGKLLDKYDVRILGTFTVLVAVLTLGLFSVLTELWQYYVLSFLAGLVVVSGTRLLVSVLTTNWFTHRRGLAVSLTLSGSGFGGMVLAPIASTMIVQMGWRSAFLFLAVICVVVVLPFTLFVFRSRPSDKGLLPYGAGKKGIKAEEKSPDKPVTVAVGWNVVRKNGGFWILIIGFIMMGVINGTVITNAVSNMTAVSHQGVEVVTGGHDPIWAGYVWSFYLAVVLVAKISLGAIYDRWGLKVGTVVGSVACLAAGVALCFPATDWGPLLVSLFFGFGTCMGTVSPPLMAVKEYGQKDIGTITGIITGFEMVGAVAGTLLSGIIFDTYLTFIPAWCMVMGASVLMGITLFISIPCARKLVAHQIAIGAPQLDAEGKEIKVSNEACSKTMQ